MDSRQPIDRFDRPLGSLRVSVTDRCNLRCAYCMPEEDYIWLPREELMTFEEITALAHIFTSLGATDVRLTGGEPLLRKDLPVLVRMLAQNLHIRDLSLTTNGVLLTEQASALRCAGLHRLTISLDTLHRERFKSFTRRDVHSQVLEGIRAARDAGFSRLKIDSVIIRHENDDELADLIEFGKQAGAEVRFIEYMDVGGATRWTVDKVFSRDEMLSQLRRRYGQLETMHEDSRAPAQRFILPDGTIFGIIASTTTPFCSLCDRSRLTADGVWYLCLYAQQGMDLRKLLRGGASRESIQAAIAESWRSRSDRGAEERKHLSARGALVPVEQLRQDPHLEMHTRGG